MRVTDTFKAQGQVKPSFINLETGKSLEFSTRANTLSYDASSAMAYVFGGDFTKIPNRIGIIYKNESSPTQIPDFTSGDRDQPWDRLELSLNSTDSDIQICPFSFSPTVTKGADKSSVTFHAHTNSESIGLRGSKFTTDSAILQAVLLSEVASALGPVYTVIARVSLEGAESYPTKPQDFELALDWTINFK